MSRSVGSTSSPWARDEACIIVCRSLIFSRARCLPSTSYTSARRHCTKEAERLSFPRTCIKHVLIESSDVAALIGLRDPLRCHALAVASRHGAHPLLRKPLSNVPSVPPVVALDAPGEPRAEIGAPVERRGARVHLCRNVLHAGERGDL